MKSTMSCLDAQAMAALIQQAYHNKWNWVHTSEAIEHATLTGAFSKSDTEACKRCKEQRFQACEDETVANYNAGNKTVQFINIEQLLNSFRSRKGRKCDFMFYCDDYSRFVLNELTCMKHAFIFTDGINQDGKRRTGKRKKVRDQLKTIINELMSMPETKSEIDKFATHTALFSCRISDADSIAKEYVDSAMRNMGIFIQSSTPTNSLRSIEHLEGRFVWEERRYPEVFEF